MSDLRTHPLSILLLSLVLACASPVRGDEAAPRTLDESIDRGVAWLLAEQRSNGTWGSGSRAVGHTALAVFTLLHAGIDEETAGKEGKQLRRALGWLEKRGPGSSRKADEQAGTYETSLLVLVERARGRALDIRMRRLVGILERAQAENGQWSYAAVRGGRRHDAGDNSNAQFAVLALGAAAGEGVTVKEDVLLRALSWWRSSVQRDGGYGYASGGSLASSSTGSMTAAGIAALAILEAALAHVASPPPTKAIRMAAIRRLAKDHRVDRNFGPAQGGAAQRQRNAGRGWVHYYLWSVERAMVLAGHERLAEKDWYAEGRDHLLATQRKDGSWRGEHPLYATCFALLFLTRAADPPRAFTPPERDAASGTVTPGEPPEPREVNPAADVPEQAPAKPVGDDTSLRQRLQEGAAPAAVLAFVHASGPAILLELARALDHRDAKVRQRANEALHTLLGPERVGDAARHPLARGRLRLWLRTNLRHLVRQDGDRYAVP